MSSTAGRRAFATRSSFPIEKERLYDEYNIPNMSTQPSDEWTIDHNTKKKMRDEGEVMVAAPSEEIKHDEDANTNLETAYLMSEEPVASTLTDNVSKLSSKPSIILMEKSYTDKSYTSNQSFVEYFKSIKTKINCSPEMYNTKMDDNNSFSVEEKQKQINKRGRCYLEQHPQENLEDEKREQRDEQHNQNRREERRRHTGDDCTRDENVYRNFVSTKVDHIKTTTTMNATTPTATLQNRCIIENTENIKKRSEERTIKNNKLHQGGSDNDHRPARVPEEGSTTSCSVEEISQISELTMDIPTVVAESRYVGCATLPTISEVHKFEASPRIVACTEGALFVKNKARCGAGKHNNTDGGNSNNNDLFDFVFELVEGALCTPVTEKRAGDGMREKNKVTKKTSKREELENAVKGTHKKQSSIDTHLNAMESTTNHTTKLVVVDMSQLSGTGIDPENVKKSCITDATGTNNADPDLHASNDEDQTLDWSKIMSYAEDQLEAAEEEILTISNNDPTIRSAVNDGNSSGNMPSSYCGEDEDSNGKLFITTRLSSSENNTVITTSTASITASEDVMAASQKSDDNYYDDLDDGDDTVTSLFTDSCSTIHETHATVVSNVATELRELSAIDSSSFEEEEVPSRFFLTPSLLQFMRGIMLKRKSNDYQDKEKEQMLEEAHENFLVQEPHDVDNIFGEDVNHPLFIGPKEEFSDEIMIFKLFRYFVFTQKIIFQAIHYILFIMFFLFLPTGISGSNSQKQSSLESKEGEEAL